MENSCWSVATPREIVRFVLEFNITNCIGAIIIVFGLCMLAYYTPEEVSSLFDSYQMNGSSGFSSVGATSAQVIKGGFSMLLIGFGATDICAFGAKYMKAKKREQK